MKNLKIAQKLILAFGVVLVLMVINVVFPFLAMKRIEGVIKSYHDDIFIDTMKIHTVKSDVLEAAKNICIAILDHDVDDAQDRIDTAKTNIETATATVNYLKENFDGDQKIITGIETEVKKIEGNYNNIRELLAAEQREVAYALFEAEIAPSFRQLYVYIDSAIEFSSNSAEISYDSSVRDINVTIAFSVTLGVLAVVIGVFFATLITKAIVNPILEVEKATVAMAQGDFESHLEYRSKDELGRLSDDMRGFTDRMNRVITDINVVLGEVANGNFTVQSSDESMYIGSFQGILSSMNHFIIKMNDTMAKINNASEQVAAGSDQVSSGAQALSQGATEQASSVEELAATINEIAGKINTNANNASDAHAKTDIAGSEMRDAATKMNELVAAMENIRNSSGETQKIIKTIEDIAFQTNILALNAAVEAARAGAAGKGFAVVADEVRNLAGKSAEAAKNTTTLIEGTVSAINKGNALVEEVAVKIGTVAKSTDEVAVINEAISGASKEAADSIAQITVGINQISGVVQTNSATSEESAAASEELSGQARMLKELVEDFKLKR